MMPSNPFGIEIFYNITTCAQMCQEHYQPDILTYQKITVMLAILVIGLALLLIITKPKKTP